MVSSPVKPSQDALTVRRLRLGIGTVGIALPIMLIVGNTLATGRLSLLDSISGYYYSDMRDVFVGSMCAIGVFFICYRYQRLDDVLSTIGGVLALVVALFPAATGVPADTISSTDRMIGWVHQTAAAALFLLLAVFCIFLFTRPGPATSGVREKKRVGNWVYHLCGGVILAAVVLALASNTLPESTRDTIKPLFWCEAAAVFAFGAAWLVKGEAIIRDSRGTGAPPGGEPVLAQDRSTSSTTPPAGVPVNP